MHFDRNSLFTRLFLLFLVLVLPIQLACTLLFSWSKDVMQNDIKNSADANVSFLKTNFDTQLYDLNSQLNMLVIGTDNTIRRFYIESQHYSNSDYWLTLSSIMAKLKFALLCDNFAQEIVVYYPSLGISVSSNGVFKIDMEELRAEVNAYNRQGTLAECNSSFFTAVSFPWNQYIDSDCEMPAIFIKAVISQSTIQHFLSTFSTYNNYSTFLIDHNTGTVLMDSQSENKGLNQISNAELINIQSGNQFTADNFLAASYSDFCRCTFVQCMPLDSAFSMPNRFIILFTLYIIASIFILLFCSMLLRKIVISPIHSLASAFQKMREGDFGTQLTVRTGLTEIRYLIDNFNLMSSRLNDLIERIYKQELLNKEMEFKQLQTQINPHFLFNSLYTLSHLIQDEENDIASKLASYLGDYFQYITRTGVTSMPLQREYDHAKAYLEIQKLRFGKHLSAEMEPLPERAKTLMVPKLILQPLLENSLMHGIKTKSGIGIVKIHFAEDKSDLYISVEDNGSTLSDAALEKLQRQLSGEIPVAETTALFNINKRLQFVFGEGYGITAERSELGGLKICIRICRKDDA